MKLVRWVAFYDDGERYSSDTDNWNDLPMHGLLVVIEFYDNGMKQKHYNKDFYVMDEAKLFGTNDLEPYLAKLKNIKRGRWSSDARFHEAIRKADEA